MKTFKMLPVLALACWGLLSCNNDNSTVTSADSMEPKVMLAVPIEDEPGPADILKDYIKVVDDFIQLNRDQDSAEKLGVTAEQYEHLCKSYEQINESIKEQKERNPDIKVNILL